MGLRRWGRAWGKIYREVGGRKTATQCKQFYDDFCNDESLGLAQVLTERSSIKVRGGGEGWGGVKGGDEGWGGVRGGVGVMCRCMSGMVHMHVCVSTSAQCVRA